MKNKLIMVFLIGICLTAACAGNDKPKQVTDTIAKRDVTKDTLGVDTNKGDRSKSDPAGIKPTDTSKQVKTGK